MRPDVDVLIVGAGISGIGAGIELLRRGNRSFLLLEAARMPGGTWRDNTYPGIAVDIPAASYCYPFETDFPWSRTFAPGAEILRYVLHCADKYGVTSHIRCETRVTRSEFASEHDLWETRVEDGAVMRSRYLMVATGVLCQPKLPGLPGLESFTGKTMHTARWDHDYDLAGKRVAIIGTGASAVQIVPEIAPRVAQLRVFQRTPIWVSPRLDWQLDGRPRAALARTLSRFVSEAGLEFLSFAIVNFRRFPIIVRTIQRLVRSWMRRQIRDADTAARLMPAYGLGCKRPTPSNTYLQAFNRDNVQLVTQPIERVTPRAIVTTDGTRHDADALIFATGFLTTERGNAPSFDVVNGDGVELGQFWEKHRRQSYAGVSVAGFPNLFLTAGPYSGGFNWFTMLDAHLAHIIACMDKARARGATRVEVTRKAHDCYMRRMWNRADGTVFKDASCAGANSYYIDRLGDASLPIPHTAWWRVARNRWVGTRDYDFSSALTSSAREESVVGDPA